MTGDGLITIGGLARACGLTASALRFYDDCGLLVPVRVDEVTGYRYYGDAQVDRGVMIRRLREIGVPLEVVSEILHGDGARAGRLLDKHVAELARRAHEAAAVAQVIKEEIGAGVMLSAAVLAAAIEQVRSAAALDREIPVLSGVLVESSAESVTLTATDRYRLSTRAMAPLRPSAGAWSVVVDAAELGGIGFWLRGLEEVSVRAADDGLVFTSPRAVEIAFASPRSADDRLTSTGDGSEWRCSAIDAEFPDYRAMLSQLGAVRTRVVVGRDALLTVLEDGCAAPVVFSVNGTGLFVNRDGQLGHDSLRRAERIARLHIPAVCTGPDIDIAFFPTTLRPALVSAIGPEIMLDIAAADAPVVVRSATDGELTTLVMPTAITNSKECGA